MIKQLRSWWKDTEIPNLIGRKKVDYSVFIEGSHIPVEFQQDFLGANQGKQPNLGEGIKAKLIYKDQNFDANLVKIDQRTASRESLKLRYNGNQILKDFLIKTFSHSYSFIMDERTNQQSDDVKKPQVVVPEDQAEYIDFYATGVPFEYRLEFITYQPKPSVWWVNQGTTIQAEKDEGIMWAPLLNTQGRKLYHWETMKEVKQGDIILHYSNKAIRYVSQVTDAAVEAPKPGSMANTSWQEDGRLVRTRYMELIPPIALQQFNQQIMQLNITQGPLHSGGGVNQGYLFRFSRQGLNVLQALTTEVVWPEFTILDQDETASSMESLREVIPILPPSDPTISTYLHQIQSHIRRQGFFFPEHLIENFYLSLKAKPFVILAGISGTGKTRLVKLFAEALGATRDNGQFSLIPVRPDWSDPADLLGYKDLSGRFQPGPITKVLVDARQPENRHKPYFICLDEMNLARVEHYFSDMLSVLETQEWREGAIQTQDLISPTLLDTPEDQETYGGLGIPENVFLIGTVNMDETTHPFSKKVLDRANTLEFNYINLQQYPLETGQEAGDPAELTELNHLFVRSDYLQLVDAYDTHKELVVRTTERLVKINTLLEDIHAHVGFRVRDAICFYMIYNDRYGLMDEEEAFDWQLLQKILPRIQGSHSSVRRVLLNLMKVAIGSGAGITVNVQDLTEDASPLYTRWAAGQNPPGIKHPQSARKLAFMLRRLEEDGFTSFWLS
ncbi:MULTISPECIES: AAA family ATPase [unclassified Paenibacillus]|uniref:McrB family protein n=1 Tax=unclassified Paenibacillus TaxID=185978 RepID=UPI0024060515|nr:MULTISPECIES: AAA family ATPase [unclassified Paenibacillus]MDF9843738.1 5-methylcytosine-specific restriction protein B [Paenibacillus sp. PastF-2]MDF9851784.1 5-methylcytosine-specific restriction protein B [Paenibacillus sp. PastM-2]MDF9858348.1 5-methylcytosine-specific restriction protein B [Paenibacillus sp. PastF-1]MDH6483636.1 5-methylcytosine-specific restriction protein B [Paenibacillus sp. PastH-2]MDH6505072.1 5-methylcytosine-specific restriction protein B [Paenibacillus sp. Pas